MASPVITKPILMHDGWHAAIIILRTPALDDLEAQLESKTAGDIPVRHDQIAGPAVSGFVPMRGKATALDALAAFVMSKGFIRYEAQP